MLSSVLLAATTLPVVVDRVAVGPPSVVALRNTGSQPVTAWSLATTIPSARGARRVVETIDGYLSEVTQGLPGSSPRTSRLQPGESRELMVDPLPTGAVVEVVAVVLEDGTGLGDEATLASIFDRRAAEREALRGVVDTFDTVLTGKRGSAALRELAMRFAVPAGAAETDPHRAARAAVDAYLRRATATNDDEMDRLLRAYVNVVRREYRLAEQHATRRAADKR